MLKKPAIPTIKPGRPFSGLSRALLIALVLALPMAPAAGQAGQAGQDPLPDTIAAVRPSVVGIGTHQENRSPAVKILGTGFAIGDGRHIITNMHVVPRDYNMEKGERLVVLPTGERMREILGATTVYEEDRVDLAVLRFEGRPLPALELGNSGAVREGERLAFTGFPIGMALGLYPTTHGALVAGVIPTSSPAPTSRTLDPRMVRQLRDTPDMVFQLDATAYPGNSGSPLYRPDTGQVVGVINRVFVGETRENLLTNPTGISYAIPMDLIRKRLDDQGIRY